MKVDIDTTLKTHCYFYIVDNFSAYTSKSISKLFNLNVDLYNKLLIDKVIEHDNYIINERHKDLMFNLNNIPEEVYIDRFKETFVNWLTLITLGGVQ